MSGPMWQGSRASPEQPSGWRDWVKEMNALVRSHPTLTWIPPKATDGPHVATWDDDDGSHLEERERLSDLVRAVRARLRG